MIHRFSSAGATELSLISKFPVDDEKRTLSDRISLIRNPETIAPSFNKKPFTTALRAARSSCQAIPDNLISAGA
jgi:hypothetical protein